MIPTDKPVSTFPVSFTEKQGAVSPAYMEGESKEEWLDRLRSSLGAEYAASAEYLLNSLGACITKKEGVATINGLVAAKLGGVSIAPTELHCPYVNGVPYLMGVGMDASNAEILRLMEE